MRGMKAKRLRRAAKILSAVQHITTNAKYKDTPHQKLARAPAHAGNMPGVIQHPKLGLVIPYQVYTREMVDGLRYVYQNLKTSIVRGYPLSGTALKAWNIAKTGKGQGAIAT